MNGRKSRTTCLGLGQNKDRREITAYRTSMSKVTPATEAKGKPLRRDPRAAGQMLGLQPRQKGAWLPLVGASSPGFLGGLTDGFIAPWCVQWDLFVGGLFPDQTTRSC